ncbi:MAG TPA: TIR domain-containing protein [Candidatus Kapabacteria bacterium]|nr:TIR domain-containing protein [Candidatus Kapabacteria bacterium]
MTDIFISYSSLDKDKAVRLSQRLRDAGFSIWMDDTDISAAAKWSSAIVRAIEECKVFIVLLSSNSFGSHNVIKELSLASEGKKHIIPVELEDAIDLTHEVKYQLAGIQRASYKEYERIEAAIRSFISVDVPAHTSSAPTVKARSPIMKYAVGILVAALAAGAYFLLSAKQTATQGATTQQSAPEKTAPAVTIKKLFVLPFESLGSDKQDDFFADGVTAQTIAALSGSQGFQIIDLKTAMNYKGRKGDIAAVAKELGVRYVVDGTVQKHGTIVKVTAELVDADSVKVLLSDQFDGTADDLSGLEGKLTRSITAKLQGTPVHEAAAPIESVPHRQSSPHKPATPKPKGRDYDRIYPGSN